MSKTVVDDGNLTLQTVVYSGLTSVRHLSPMGEVTPKEEETSDHAG